MKKQQYIEYRVATCGNYTCTNLADHLEGRPGTSHDAISDFLRRDKRTARELWDLVAPLIDDSEDAYLILDDSVQNKEYSKSIELVNRQYSGAVHGLVRGIGVVNLVNTNGEDGDYYPIDFRIYDRSHGAKAPRYECLPIGKNDSSSL